MITNLEVLSVERSLVDKDEYQQVRNYFVINEPQFVEWMSKIAKMQTSNMNLPLPANINELIESKMVACGMAGALAAMTHQSSVSGGLTGIESYKVLLNNDPYEIWNAWVKGDLPDKFYTEEYAGNNVPSWKEAVANHEAKTKESEEYNNRWELIKKADNELPKEKKKVAVDL